MNILVNRDGTHLGPYSYDQACQLLAEGKLQAWDIAWPDGGREWVTLDQIDGLTERAFALREQRRSETMATNTGGPTKPNAQFISSKTNVKAPKRDWRRVWVWSIMVPVLGLSLFIWVKNFNKKILIENLERQEDSRLYFEGDNKPFSGDAYAYFNDDSLWEQVRYDDGVRHGKRAIWHINGNLALKERYYNGTLETAVSYDFNGKASGQYRDGTGTITLYWNESGIRAQEQVYANGDIVKRTIWSREGQLLSIIQPSGQTGQSIALTSNITNQSPSTLPIKIASSNNVATIPGLLPARAKVWSIGGDGTPTIRGDVEKRIDLIYANKFYTKIIEDFGNPDEIIEGRIYAYRNMRVHYFSDGSFRTQVHFHFINGKVTRTEALP